MPPGRPSRVGVPSLAKHTKNQKTRALVACWYLPWSISCIVSSLPPVVNKSGAPIGQEFSETPSCMFSRAGISINYCVATECMFSRAGISINYCVAEVCMFSRGTGGPAIVGYWEKIFGPFFLPLSAPTLRLSLCDTCHRNACSLCSLQQ